MQPQEDFIIPINKYRFMKKLILVSFLLAHSFLTRAQLPNDSLEYRIKPDTAKTGHVELSIYNFNFLRNYEFFNKFQDGYTLYGTQLEPRLVYYAHPKLVISAGVHIRKDFGSDGIQKTYPLFTLKYRFKNTEIINGSLEGNVHHRLIEPIFDFERKLNNPVEYGTQVVINKSSLFLDGFINWSKMIEKYSPFQEQIFAGFSADLTLWKKNNVKLSIPLQLLAYHQGGQIDTDPTPLQTIANTAAGFKVTASREGLINSFKTENYVVNYSELSPTKTAVYKSGKALFFNAGFGTRYGSLYASYWDGQKYLSPAGMPIYQSLSQHIDNAGYTEKSRQLLFLRYIYQRELVPHFFLDFRVEPVFDLGGSSKTEFYHSLFFVYKQDFKLFKRK